jgi:hypothetical protein
LELGHWNSLNYFWDNHLSWRWALYQLQPLNL